jgi:predicted transcriptional regulator
MSVAQHHRFRISEGLTWRGEFALAIIAEEGEIKTSYLAKVGLNLNGVREIIEQLVNKGFINVRVPDKVKRLVSVSDKGIEYLNKVKEFYK